MIYFIYTLLLVGFLIISGLILRYLLKFGQLAPKFKWVVILFGNFALITLIFSIYLLTQLGSPTLKDDERNTGPSNSSINDLNF